MGLDVALTKQDFGYGVFGLSHAKRIDHVQNR